MKTLGLLITLFFTHWIQAQVLLLPASDLSFESYKERCAKEGYICTTNYFLQQLQQQETPQFDSLLNDLDYSSEKFCSELPSRALSVLKEEPISLEQVEVLQKLIEQVKEFSNPARLRQLLAIEKQIKNDLQLIQNEALVDLPDSFDVVFKTPISNQTKKKLKFNLFKIKTTKIEFNQVPESQKNLVVGSCENEIVDSTLQHLKWQVTREQSCSFSEQFSRASVSTSNFISENKTTLLVVGAVAVGAVLLLKNYEVQFSF